MSKGISEIISGILIVLVVISLAGAFLLWSSGAFTQASQTGTQGLQQFGATAQKAVSIDAMACDTTDTLTIRNTGNVAWTASTDVTVYKNEVPLAVTWPAGSTAVNGIATVSSGFVAASGDTIRVAVSGGVRGDSRRCP